MNLLELMLKKKVVWPVGMRWAVQDKDGEVKFACKSLPKPPAIEVWNLEQETEQTRSHTLALGVLANDWRTRIVYRNGYRAAGGWMEWKGGECPVPKETPILYTTKMTTAEPARAGACSWEHFGRQSDILAYCLTAIIPGNSANDAEEALTRLYTKLGVTTLEAAFAVIDEWVPTSVGHTIARGETIFRDCTIVLQTEKSVVWVHNKEEYITPLTEILIDPSQDELTAYLLSGLCKAQVTPAHIAEVREQVHWVYRENQ